MNTSTPGFRATIPASVVPPGTLARRDGGRPAGPPTPKNPAFPPLPPSHLSPIEIWLSTIRTWLGRYLSSGRTGVGLDVGVGEAGADAGEDAARGRSAFPEPAHREIAPSATAASTRATKAGSAILGRRASAGAA